MDIRHLIFMQAYNKGFQEKTAAMEETIAKLLIGMHKNGWIKAGGILGLGAMAVELEHKKSHAKKRRNKYSASMLKRLVKKIMRGIL